MRVLNLKTAVIGTAIALAVGLGAFAIAPSIAQSPPGSLTQEQRAAIFGKMSDAERQKFFAMTPKEKGAFIRKKLAEMKDAKPGAPTGGARPGSSAGGAPRRGGFRPPLVELAKVKVERLSKTFPVTGRVVARQAGIVASRLSGRVVSVNFDVGDRVKQGQVLVELDTDRLKLEAELKAAEVIQARARWNAAKAQVDLLNQTVKRLATLKGSAAFNPARLEDQRQEVVKAKAAVDEAAASLKHARAARDLARIDLRDAAIRAPFSGAVTNRNISPGAYLNPGSPVAMLLDENSLEIEADVPSARLKGLDPGTIVDIDLDAETKLKAAVRAVIPDENPLARTRAVRLTPDTTKLKTAMIANQAVTVHVPQGKPRDVMVIPKDAIVNRSEGTIVFVFNGGTVRPAAVTIGESFDDMFEVLTGLRAGQQVVVTGNEGLRPGQPVRVEDKSSAAPAGARGPSAAGPGGNPAVAALIRSLSDAERQKFFAMTPEEKGAFIRERLAKRESNPGSGS